jgi:hypothetical protein
VAQQLADVSTLVDDDYLVEVMLSGLPSVHNHMAMPLKAQERR